MRLLLLWVEEQGGEEPGAHCHFGGGKRHMERLVLSTQTTGSLSRGSPFPAL